MFEKQRGVKDSNCTVDDYVPVWHNDSVMRLSLVVPPLLTTLLLAAPAHSAGIDLHAMWDDRCSQCHGHSSEFARRHLSLAEDGRLQSGHANRDLRQFLANHYLAESEVDAVYEMLRAQAGTPPRFKNECGGCHGSAAQLARQSLEVDGALVRVRGSGEPIREFMQHHRGLSTADAEFFSQVLTRVAREVHRP